MKIAFSVFTISMLAASTSIFAHEHSSLIDSPKVRYALDFIEEHEPEAIDEQIVLCEIPAPSFKEEVRAAYYRNRFVELGLENVRIDDVGNVIGERPGSTDGPVLLFSAHLDTVFPEGTDVTVTREGNILKGPGIGDDCRGLTLQLSVIRALRAAEIVTKGKIYFVGTVGEEGLGNLRGVRHLFNDELKGQFNHFISIDGRGLGATVGAVGSNRYKVTYNGPGGHSHGAFGLVNPIHALGRAIEKISRFEVSKDPKVTFNVGRIGGGTSINSISFSTWMEVDMRSVAPDQLSRLDAKFQHAIQDALQEENAFWRKFKGASADDIPQLTVEVKSVGIRPAGQQDPNSSMLKAIRAADSAMGITSDFGSSSTDSNIAISIGMPAATLRGGGAGAHGHSLLEEFDTTDSHLGPQRALLVILEIVGME